MKALGLGLVALLALVVAAVALAPATLVDAQLAQATSGRLRLQDAAGTVWRGRGALADAQGTAALPIAWTVDALALLRGEVALDFVADAAHPVAPRGRIAWHPGRWTVEGLQAVVPAAMLPALAPAGSPVALGGTIRIDVPRLVLARERYDGQAALAWTGATLALPMLPALALGEVDVALSQRGEGIGGPLSSRDGPLQLTGDLAVDPARTALEVTLVPGPQAPPLLARALAALGRGAAQGAQWRWQGPPLLR